MWKPQKPPFRAYKKNVFQKIMVTADFVYQIGESEDLRKSSKEVPLKEITTPDFQKKIAYLKSCMLEYRKLTGMGRGITAVQVGIPQRFSVIYMPLFSRHSGKQRFLQNPDSGSPKGTAHFVAEQARMTAFEDMVIIINPVITRKSKDLLRYPEICMSANPIIAPVVRPSWIEFSYIDEQGKKQVWEIKDASKEGKLYNRVFQHEIDHMDGIINIDKVQSEELIFESDPTFYDTAKFEKIRNKLK